MQLPKITHLRQSLRDAGWCMTAFLFSFNGVESIVIFEDARALGREGRYVAAILTFRDLANVKRFVEVSANAGGIDLTNSNKREFFDYFHIQYKQFDDFWRHFNSQLTDAMPSEFSVPVEKEIVNAVNYQLGYRNNDTDPNARYCYEAFRLRKDPRTGKQMHRSPFIDTKTRMWRPNLYTLIHAETEPTITFKYSADPLKEVQDEVILREFGRREMET